MSLEEGTPGGDQEVGTRLTWLPEGGLSELTCRIPGHVNRALTLSAPPPCALGQNVLCSEAPGHGLTIS